jgi:uncharacterized phiE125 gp8 family phage protein
MMAPVAIGEVKAFLRVDGSGEDALIAGFIRSAAESCEAFTGRVLIAREVRESVAATGGWVRLAAGPVMSIDGVAGIGPDGAESALAADAYAVDVDAAGDGWVRVLRATGVKRAAVRFTAGMAGDWNGVPEPLRQGIVRLAAHLYGARGENEAPVPVSVAALWRPWRRLRMG